MSDDRVVPLRVVGSLMDDAALAPPPIERDPDEPPPPTGRGRRLPRGFPITPLGHNGGVFYFLDRSFQLRQVAGEKLVRAAIRTLAVGDNAALIEAAPRMGAKGPSRTNWDGEILADILQRGCYDKGIIDVTERVRGPGAWRDPDDSLVLHCGDRVLRGPRDSPPGEYGGYIYPAGEPIPKPAPLLSLAGDRSPARDLLALLKTWNWARPEIDPHLLLGWIGAAKIGGALHWRPTLWPTGDLSTGKSTLLNLLRLIFGAAAVHYITDSTAAGIWQRVKHSSLPVMLDEAEAETTHERMRRLVNLARQASSGAIVLRGGADHQATSFTVRSCFLFSSILMPGLPAQDWSRITHLDLMTLAGARPPPMPPAKMAEIGAALSRRLVDHFGRLPAVLEAWRKALIDHGHDARGADQYGTLLACAELLLSDDETIATDWLDLWGERLSPKNVQGFGDSKRDHDRCVDRIMSYVPDPFRQARRTIAQWCADALRADVDQPATANGVLETWGLKVEIERLTPAQAVAWLHVANQRQRHRADFRRHPLAAPGRRLGPVDAEPAAVSRRGPLAHDAVCRQFEPLHPPAARPDPEPAARAPR